MILREGPVLLFGGCYSNLQATEALLARAGRLGIPTENIICTGDIVAYGADAAATLRLVREAGIASIAGNCEEALATAAPNCGCGFAAGSACDALATEWYGHAARQISDEDRAYMAALPRQLVFTLGGRTFRVVHGNAERINAFVFPSASNLELARQLDLAGTDAVIAGHCGIPFTRRLGAKIWHNPGSIGMPANDGTPRVWFSILEVRGGQIIFTPHQLDYDFSVAAAAMRAAALPEGYAAALATGIWPSLDILPGADRLLTGVALEHRDLVAAPPVVRLDRLETLWVNTGTLCNLSCAKCFMESTPTNDSLSYIKHGIFAAMLADVPAPLTEIGFTGGEPFMNPDIMALLTTALGAARRVLILTNAMRPMRRHQDALQSLIAAHPGRIALRVSLDHYLAARHDALRGRESFALSLAGLKFLQDAGARISVAARTPWGETEAMMRAGFAALFAAEAIGLDAHDPDALVLFPEMDTDSPSQPVTVAPADMPLMCRTSRMIVQRKGETNARITPCTLLPNRELPAFDAAVTLDHPHCGQFCVHGGASCKG